MADYKIILKSGYVHEGDDERYIDDLLAVIAPASDNDVDPELPKGWCWIASLYVKQVEIAGIILVPVNADA